MATAIRLARRGRGKRPFYHIVVADTRAPRDGKYIEKLGIYNPLTQPATIELNTESALDWVMKGAQPSDTARAILSYKGVMYKKHLQMGVNKGAIKQAEADKKYDAWIADKEKVVSDGAGKIAKSKEDARKKALEAEKKKSDDRAAALKAKEDEAIAAAEAAEAEANAPEEAPAAEEGTENVEAAATEETPAAETTTEEAPAAEEAKEEAPAAEEKTEEK